MSAFCLYCSMGLGQVRIGAPCHQEGASKSQLRERELASRSRSKKLVHRNEANAHRQYSGDSSEPPSPRPSIICGRGVRPRHTLPLIQVGFLILYQWISSQTPFGKETACRYTVWEGGRRGESASMLIGGSRGRRGTIPQKLHMCIFFVHIHRHCDASVIDCRVLYLLLLPHLYRGQAPTQRMYLTQYGFLCISQGPRSLPPVPFLSKKAVFR